MVDSHNYPACNSVQQKVNNWNTLERKVLRKINVVLNDTTVLKLAEANTDTVKVVLYETMQKSQVALAAKASNISNASENSQTCKLPSFYSRVNP